MHTRGRHRGEGKLPGIQTFGTVWFAETSSGSMVQMNQRFTNSAWVQHRVKPFDLFSLI
jgi:hypothetical protein